MNFSESLILGKILKKRCVWIIKFLGSDTTYPLGSAHLSSGKNAFYPLGKKHFPRGGGILSSGKNAFYPRGKKKHIYPMVSDTLSSGKWHIILWEKKLIPSGNWTMGNWKITVESFTINLSIHCRNKILLDKLYEGWIKQKIFWI